MKYTVVPCILALVSSFALAQANPQDQYAQQLRTMQDMHKRMQAAQTPAEKQALLREHMKLMQSGMEMMSQMTQDSGAIDMEAMPGAPSAGAPVDKQPSDTGPPNMGGMNDRMAMHGSMERRMAIMEQMMQMMVDREAALPRR